MQGKILVYNNARGFGWIQDQANFRNRIFFHFRNYLGETEPFVGQLVEFMLAPGKVGKGPQAVDVRPIAEPKSAADILAGHAPAAPTRDGGTE